MERPSHQNAALPLAGTSAAGDQHRQRRFHCLGAAPRRFAPWAPRLALTYLSAAHVDRPPVRCCVTSNTTSNLREGELEAVFDHDRMGHLDFVLCTPSPSPRATTCMAA